MKVYKLALFLLIIFLLAPIVSAATISNYSVSPSVRLGEKVSVFGTFDDGNTFILCRFIVYSTDTNVPIDRWTDEFTFSDGTFYAEKTMLEPPYYRGDDFNLVTTCGDAQEDAVFTVGQPVSLAQPIQSNWEYFFDSSNLDAGMLFVAFIGAVVTVILLAAFILKKGGQFAS